MTSAGIRRVTPSLKLLGFLRWMRSHDADLVQTWMYHGDLVGGFYRLTGGRSPVVWNVRRARFGRRTMKAPTRLAAQACACLSHIAPARIVVNSLAGAQFHQRRGYAAAKMTVIPNGVDTRVFKPDPAARGNLRRKLALKEDAVLVAHVARYHLWVSNSEFGR